MSTKSIGDQELALLTYIAERGGATVGEVAEGFGAPRGLARSTVLTMMERLRLKKRLVRRRYRGVFRYASPASPGDVLRDVVGSFVEGTLGRKQEEASRRAHRILIELLDKALANGTAQKVG
ncbi:MAG: BlaI/MecI/CopY family transcriptional regulator [Vicinamibacteraceae bacterium]